MRYGIVKIMIPCVMLSFLGGCTLDDRNTYGTFTAAKLAYQSAEAPVVVPDVIRSVVCSVDLPKALGAQGPNGEMALSAAQKCVGDAPSVGNSISYAASVAAFYRVYDGRPDAGFARNRVQDAIMKAADQRCGEFKVQLEAAGAFEESATGVIAVITGTLGGLLQSAEAARSLAATSGIVSGSGAVISKAVFRNGSLKVIKTGIDLKRLELTEEFQPKRASELSSYSLEHAVRDAIRYGDACDIMEGLSKISDEVAQGGAKGSAERSADNGAGAVINRIDKLSAARFVAFAQLDPNKTLAAQGPLVSGVAENQLEGVLKAAKLKYKTNVLAASESRLSKLLLMLSEAEKS
ncbi:hypothetical protein [Azospirillum sp.]|uniref:hypothetical protein n=1 Tax=Azospirillum sp. TaxID=34012 RepID=UPI002620FCEF|nr:hypothetical protein [Azospirillum sp.]